TSLPSIAPACQRARSRKRRPANEPALESARLATSRSSKAPAFAAWPRPSVADVDFHVSAGPQRLQPRTPPLLHLLVNQGGADQLGHFVGEGGFLRLLPLLDQNQVETEGRLHRLADPADGQGEGRLLKGRHHHAAAEPAQVAAVGATAR